MILGRLYTALTGRDRRWPAASRKYRRAHPDCVVCGRPAGEVHHVEPVHVSPSREMDEANWASVCRPCHFVVGHGQDWTGWVPEFRAAAALIRGRS